MITLTQFLLNEQNEDASDKPSDAVNASQLAKDAQHVLKTGVTRLLKMDHPQKGETDEQHAKRSVDAFDIMEAIEVLRKFFEDTKDAVGTKMRRGDADFDYLREIRNMVNEYYLQGSTEKEGALQRRKYRAMVQVLIEPMLDLFKGVPHQKALDVYDSVLDSVIRYVKNSDVITHADDAFVQRRLIQKEVQRNNKVTRTVDGIMALRKGKNKRK